jgi:hypothetical protein
MTTIQFRRGTASQATTDNPILAAGEPGYELGTGKLKIGDGSTAWTALPYFAGSGSGTATTDASQLTTGTLAAARLPATVVQTSGGVILDNLIPASIARDTEVTAAVASRPVYRHGQPTDPLAYPVGTFVYDVDAAHLYEITAGPTITSPQPIATTYGSGVYDTGTYAA